MKSILLIIALVFILAACNKAPAQAVKTVRPALTQIVGAAPADGSTVYSGEIHARHEVSLGFRVSGKMIERLVDAGMTVKAGQVLARLDPVDAGFQAGAAKAQYELADDEARRYRELQSRGFVSRSALDAKETALSAAKAQAGLMHNQTDYTTLRAAHDGVVAATLAEVGQVVGAGQPVLRLAEAGELEVLISIPEDQYAQHRVGEIAQVFAGTGAPMNGRLRELSPAADPLSRTYPARVAFAATSGQVALGMSARVSFNKHSTPLLLIPLSAVYQQGRQTAVWVVAADHSVSLRRVQIAAYRDEGAVIASGLAVGERIVSAGVHRLSGGEKIQFIETGKAP